MTTTVIKTDIKVQISPDKCQTYLKLQDQGDYKEITDLEIFEILKKEKIGLDDFVKKQVAELIETLHAGNIPTEPYLAAKGKPAVEPTDQEFVWDESFQQLEADLDDQQAVNFYTQHKLVTVESDTVIGKILPAKEGENGIDVFGRTLIPKRKPANIKIDENIKLENDGETLRSLIPGQVTFRENKISIKDVLDINGDVDFETGNVESASDVLIRGSIKDLFIVRSKHNISVKGLVEAAYLFADGNIDIAGGVKGRGKAIILSKGDIHAKFLNFVYLQAGGDVDIARESMDSTIICDGSLAIKSGSLVSGHAYSLKGAKIKSVGSPSEAKTKLGVAFNPITFYNVLELGQKIEDTKSKIEKIRNSIAPLLKQREGLTPQQREKATELMYLADQMEQQNQQRKQEKENLMMLIPEPTEATLTVTSRILPNSEIHIHDRFTTIEELIKGPVKISLKKVEGVTEMVMVNQMSGSTRTLPSQKIELNLIEIPQKPKITQPGATNNQEQKN